MFVADFIGSPADELPALRGRLQPAATAVALDGAEIAMPEVARGRRRAELVLGVRPEHVALIDDGGAARRVFGAEYLGTTQIVTLDTAARPGQGAHLPSVRSRGRSSARRA